MNTPLLQPRVEAVGGRALRVARLGEGPPLLLLHGYPENLLLFSRLAPLLARRHTVFAFDWPGMGESEAWPGGATPLHQARRLVTLLDHWGLTRASFFGTDMGGQPALALAAEHPERVEALVVSNSLVSPSAPTSLDIRLLRRFALNRLLLRRMPRAVFWRARRSFLQPGEALPEELIAGLWSSFRRPEVRAFIVRMCAGYEGYLDELERRYERVRAPTLFLWAEHEGHFPLVQAELAAARVKGAKVERIEGANHWMVWTHAEQVAARVLGHFEAYPPPAQSLPNR